VTHVIDLTTNSLTFTLQSMLTTDEGSYSVSVRTHLVDFPTVEVTFGFDITVLPDPCLTETFPAQTLDLLTTSALLNQIHQNSVTHSDGMTTFSCGLSEIVWDNQHAFLTGQQGAGEFNIVL